jgi:hypothetical protein
LAYVWYQAYLRYQAVTEPTFFVTFIVSFIITYLLYQFLLYLTQPVDENASTTTVRTLANQAVAMPTNWFASWQYWLGKGEPQRGTLLVLAVIFASVLFWNSLNLQLIPEHVSLWGLTVIGAILLIRNFFRPSAGGVSVNPDTKSK